MRFGTGGIVRRRAVWSLAVVASLGAAVALAIVVDGDDDTFVTAATGSSREAAAPTNSAPASTSATTTTTDAVTPPPTSAAAVPPTTRPGRVPAATAPAVTAPPTTSTSVPLGTLGVGSLARDIAMLQHHLNVASGTDLLLNGVYDRATRTAVHNFQVVIGIPATGLGDPVTRWMLADAASHIGSPSIGDGTAEGCEVAVVADSLMAGTEGVHADALAAVGCASAIDARSGRSLAFGWQCRVEGDDRRGRILFVDTPIVGNDACRPSGLTLLVSWAAAEALGDIVVVGLGTNDSGLVSRAGWETHWREALRLAHSRPVVFVTTQARPGSPQQQRQGSYSDALRWWCAGEPRCVLADWAYTSAANDAGSYVDAVHLTYAGTRARAAFIADVVAAALAGRPLPNPSAPPSTTTTTTSTTTTSTTTTSATTSTTVAAPSTTRSPPSTTTTTSTTGAPAPTTTGAATTTSSPPGSVPGTSSTTTPATSTTSAASAASTASTGGL